MLILILCPLILVAQSAYEGYYLYLDNYPQNAETAWSENVQGIAHDNEHWFISQTSKL